MKNKILIILTFLIVLGSSCSKDFMKVDEVNPNTASSVAPKLMLPSAQVQIANLLNDPNNVEFVNLWYGAFSISSSYSPNAPLILYNITNGYDNGIWDNLYIQGSNLSVIIDKSNTADTKPFRGMARTLKAMIFQYLVDTYGDVPYSQAFQTAKGLLHPAYDDQQAIYEDLVSQLDSAINDFKTTPASAILPNGNQDVMYGYLLDNGTLTNVQYLDLWARFANTLKLRILLNQDQMSGRSGYITSHLTNATGYLGVGEGAMVNPGYLQSNGKQNPFFNQWIDPAGNNVDGGLNYYVAGQDIIDFLTNTNDSRLSSYFDPGTTAGGAFKGAYYGQNANLPAPGDMATVGLNRIGNFNSSAPILPDFESLFLQAEAVDQGFLAGDANALVQSAITASYGFLNAGDASGFLVNADTTANVNVSYTAAKNAGKSLQLILTQKWASLVTIVPMTVWTDYRRSGFPTFLHFSDKAAAVGKNSPPVRLLYPNSEISYNSDMEAAAEAKAGGTVSLFTSKIFWQNR